MALRRSEFAWFGVEYSRVSRTIQGHFRSLLRFILGVEECRARRTPLHQSFDVGMIYCVNFGRFVQNFLFLLGIKRLFLDPSVYVDISFFWKGINVC